MMMGGVGKREEAEMMSLMDELEREIAMKRKLATEIRQCKELLRAAAVDRGRTERQSSGSSGTNFEALSYSRARGIQRAKLSGMYPQIKSPAAYDLGAL